MDFKTDALVIRTADYGESDRMLTLLTADRGKLSAAAKGVKKGGAKLNFAAQPFCFAEYVLAVKGGRNTVTSASLYDGFYPLRENVEAFYAAAVVAEACDKLAPEGEPCGELFVQAVRALGEMCGGDVYAALAKFLLGALDGAGYSVRADVCPVCGKTPAGRLRFDFAEGAFTCADCSEGAPASEITYKTVRGLRRGEPAERDGEVRALRLLKAHFSYHTECELPALTDLLALPR